MLIVWSNTLESGITVYPCSFLGNQERKTLLKASRLAAPKVVLPTTQSQAFNAVPAVSQAVFGSEFLE